MTALDGAKKLYRDSGLGLAVSTFVTMAALGLVEWLGTIDYSTLPTFASTTLAVLTGSVAGAITAWAAKRGKPVPPPPAGDGLR